MRNLRRLSVQSAAAIIGIKVGVGVLLITSALESALGIAPLATSFFYERFYLASVTWGDIVNPYAVIISAVTVLAGLARRKSLPRANIVIAMILGGVPNSLLYGWYGAAQLRVELLGHVVF